MRPQHCLSRKLKIAKRALEMCPPRLLLQLKLLTQSVAHGGTPLANVLPCLYRNGAFMVLVGTPSIKETLHTPQNMGPRLFNAKLDQEILIADVGYVRRPEPSAAHWQ